MQIITFGTFPPNRWPSVGSFAPTSNPKFKPARTALRQRDVRAAEYAEEAPADTCDGQISCTATSRCPSFSTRPCVMRKPSRRRPDFTAKPSDR